MSTNEKSLGVCAPEAPASVDSLNPDAKSLPHDDAAASGTGLCPLPDTSAPTTLVALRSANGLPCAKVLGLDAGRVAVVDSYGKETLWLPEAHEVPTFDRFAEVLDTLANRSNAIVIRGTVEPGTYDPAVGILRRQVGSPNGGGRWREAARTWVPIDFDGAEVPPELASDEARIGHLVDALPPPFRGRSCWFQWTSSHGLNGNGATRLRVRLWFLADGPVSGAALIAAFAPLAASLRVDVSIYRTVQPIYIARPTLRDGIPDPVQNRTGTIRGFDGDLVDAAGLPAPDEQTARRAFTSYAKRVAPVTQHPVEIANARARLLASTTGGSRHMHAMGAAVELLAFGDEPDAIADLLGELIAKQGRPAKPGEVAGILTWAIAKHASGEATVERQPMASLFPEVEEGEGVAPTGEAQAERFDFTDAEQAGIIARQARDFLRHAPGIGWLCWDGMRWASSTEKVPTAALEVAKAAAVRRIAEVAARFAGTDAGKAMLARVKRLGDLGHIHAALDLARTEPGIAIAADVLDTDPWALNCRNGTLDLRTGELRPHRREDLLTKLAAVEYRPGAHHDALDRLLAAIGAADPALPDFLARCVGASLTGDASTESLFIIQGDGGNGKTTLSDAVAAMLGDYAAKLPFASFVAAKHTARSGHGASPDLFRLRGSRFAFAAEGEQSARLDAGLVKQLTGGERLTARRLYADQVEFAQTWKLWLVSNYDPRMEADDSGIWRRVVKIPFPPLDPAKRDPRVKDALVRDPEARAALLAWAVEGCKAWRAGGRGRRGLGIPASVEAATAGLREKCDTVAQWLADCDPFAGRPAVPVTEVRDSYERWCVGAGAFPVWRQRFNEALTGRGWRQERPRTADSRGRVWVR